MIDTSRFIRLILGCMACITLEMALVGCENPQPAAVVVPSRSAENVTPEMLDRALTGLNSEDSKLQMSGLRFIESFPELKEPHAARIAELAKNAKDANVRSLASKLAQ